MYKSVFLFYAILFMGFKACTKKQPVLISKNSFSGIFNDFWQNMSKKYVFWDIDTVNWNAIYDRYRPVFDTLNIADVQDVKKSVSYFREMTKDLVDGHYSIRFLYPDIADSIIFPALQRKLSSKNYHVPVSYTSLVMKDYLDKGYYTGTGFQTNSPTSPLFVIVGTINNDITYFYCNKFFLERNYNITQNAGLIQSINFLFQVLSGVKVSKGLIIDVRGNNGGAITDLNFIASKIVQNSVCFGATHYKNGDGRLEFTPWIRACVNPDLEYRHYSKPIILLCDCNSSSMAESLAMVIDALPNGLVIGENTWGATGTLSNSHIFNAGSFDNDFLNVQSSSCAFRYLDGNVYEGIGFPPKIEAAFDSLCWAEGRDCQLEKAVSIMKQIY